MTAGLFCFIAVLLLGWMLIRLQRPDSLYVKVSPMAKQVGDTITVTVSPVPAGAPLSNYAFSADASQFSPVSSQGNVAVYTCLAPVTGAVVSATATAVDGSTVAGQSAPFDVEARVATGLVVEVA